MAANGEQETDTSPRGHLSPTASDGAHVSPTASDDVHVSPTTPARRTSAAQIVMQSDRAAVDVNSSSAPQSPRNAPIAPMRSYYLHEARPDDDWLPAELGSANEAANYGYNGRNVQECDTNEFGHRHNHDERGGHCRVAFVCMFEGTNISLPSALRILMYGVATLTRIANFCYRLMAIQ